MSARDVELRLLRYFVVTAEELHVGRAAARLFISQPALSKQIKLLEREFGVALFRRGPRGVSLTPDGSVLLPAARETLAAADRLVELVDQVAGSRTGRLRVGFVGQAANELTSVLLRRFAEQNPGVAVDLQQFAMRDLSAGLRERTVNLAIVRLPISLDGIRLQPLFTEGRVAVLPTSHPFAVRPRLAVEELFGEPWLQPESPDPVYRAFALATRQRVAAPMLGPVVRTVDELLEAVLALKGICLAPASAARYYSRPGIAYVPVVDADPSIVALAWRGDPPGLTPAGSAFVRLAHELSTSDVAVS